MDVKKLERFAYDFLFAQTNFYVQEMDKGPDMASFVKYPAVDMEAKKALDIQVISARFSYRSENFINDPGFEKAEAIVLPEKKIAIILDVSMLLVCDISFAERKELLGKNILPPNADGCKVFVASKEMVFEEAENWIRPVVLKEIRKLKNEEIPANAVAQGKETAMTAFLDSKNIISKKQGYKIVPYSEYGVNYSSQFLQDFLLHHSDINKKEKWGKNF